MIQYKNHIEKLTSSLKAILALLILVLVTSNTLFAASNGDYRSAATGNWSSLTSWERYNGSTWVTPTSGQGCPGLVTASSTITIQSGHTITFDVANTKDIGATLFQIDGVMIINAIVSLEKKATVVVNGTLTFNGSNYISQFSNGLGVAADFTVNSTATIQTQNPDGIVSSGTLGCIQIIPNHNTVLFSGAAQYVYNGTSAQTTGNALPNITSGGSLTISNTSSTVTLSKAFTIGTGATMTIDAGATLVTGYAISRSGNFNVNGILQLNTGGSVSGPPTYGNTSTLVYSQGGTATFGSEWTARATSPGIGVPQNLIIQNNTTVTLPTTDRGVVGNLNINSGTLNNNSAGGNLYVGGNWTRLSTGTFNANGRTVNLFGATAATIKAPETTTRDANGAFGGETFSSLTINKSTLATTVKLLSNITVTKTLTLTIGTLDVDTSDVLLTSNVTATADVANVVTSNATISYSSTGRFIVQRYIKNTSTIRTWRFLTAPLQATDTLTINSAWQAGRVNTNVSTPSVTNPWPGFSTQITGPATSYNASLGFDKGTSNNGYSIEYYDNSGATAKWGYPANTNSTKLMSKYAWGIFIRGDRSYVIGDQYKPSMSVTLEPRGKINIGQVTETLVAGKNNLVGNPYPCQINMTNVTIGGATHQQFKLWDPKAFTNYTNTGKYISFTWISGTTYASANSPVTVWAKPGTIESSEAFFTTPATSTIVFHETDKVSGTSTLDGVQSRPTSNPINKVSFFRADLAYYDDSLNNYTSIDGTLNLYNESYNTDVDMYEDAIAQMSGSTTGAIRIFKKDKQLSISKEKPLAYVDTVFFNLSTLKKIKHQLIFSFVDFPTNKIAILIDKYLSKETFIETSNFDTTFYDFAINADAASNASDRFMVVFRPLNTTPVKVSSVKAIPQANNIKVEWTVATETNIEKYEIERSADGITFAATGSVQLANGNSIYNWLDENAVAGNNYYRIKIYELSGATSYTTIVKVNNQNNVQEGINVYPNPVKNNTINLHFVNQVKGLYKVKLINALGQEVYTNNVSSTGGTENYVLQLNKNVPKGIYQLEVIAVDQKKQTQKISIQ